MGGLSEKSLTFGSHRHFMVRTSAFGILPFGTYLRVGPLVIYGCYGSRTVSSRDVVLVSRLFGFTKLIS